MQQKGTPDFVLRAMTAARYRGRTAPVPRQRMESIGRRLAPVPGVRRQRRIADRTGRECSGDCRLYALRRPGVGRDDAGGSRRTARGLWRAVAGRSAGRAGGRPLCRPGCDTARRTVYRRFGFVGGLQPGAHESDHRSRAVSGRRGRGAPHARERSGAVCRRDREVFGADRGRLLASLFERAPECAWVVDDAAGSRATASDARAISTTNWVRWWRRTPALHGSW